MDEALGANVAELTRALKSKGVPLPHEVGTFVALEVAQALVTEPRAVSGQSVFVNGQGQVAVADLPKAAEVEAVRSVLMLLGELLVASAPGVPDGLLALVEEASPSTSARPRSIRDLRDELEAALVPLNRSATMRILGRIAKDAFGSRRMHSAEPNARSTDEITSAIDVMLGVDSGAADALRRPPEDLVDPLVEPNPPRQRLTASQAASSPRLDSDVERMADRPRAGLRMLLLVLLFVLIAGGVAFFVRQGGTAGRSAAPARPTGAVVQSSSLPDAAVSVATAPMVTAAMVTVEVDSVPRGAQVLLRVPEPAREVRLDGAAPHEFVAILPDGRIRRTVLAAGAKATSVDLSLGSEAASLEPDLGPSLLSSAPVAGDDAGVVVAMLNAPQDARVYKLVGITPAAFPIDPDMGDVSLLLYRRGFALSELHATAQELLNAAQASAGAGKASDAGQVKLSLKARLAPHS